MEVPHPLRRFVRGDRFERATGFLVDVVKELAEMRVSVGMVNKGVLETPGFLDGLEPCIELFRRTHRCRQTAVWHLLCKRKRGKGKDGHDGTRSE